MKRNLKFIRSPGWVPWGTYALALSMTLASLFVSRQIIAVNGSAPVLMVFLIPVIMSAYVGGLGPGLTATAVAALLSRYFVLSPIHSFQIDRANDLVRWLLMVVIGVLVSLLSEMLHRSRRQVEADRKRHAVTLASIGDAVITTNREGRVTFLNPEAERLTGWAHDAALGRPLATVFHIICEETRQPVEDPVQKVLECGATVGLANHTVLIARNGRETPIDDSGAPIKQADGTVIGVVLVFRNCSEQKEAEAALYQQQQLLHETGRLANVGGWDFDPATGKGHWTEEVARIHDVDPGQEPTRELGLSFYSGESRRRIEAAIREAAEHGTPYDLELELVTAKQNHRWVRTIGEPVMENGKVVKIRGAIQDITARKLADEALRLSEECLHEVMTRTQCIVNFGAVDGLEGWRQHALDTPPPFRWEFPVINAEAAQNVLPLHVAPGESYHQAWTRSRHPADHVEMDRNSANALLQDDTFYHNEFRCTDRHGAEHWMRQYVTVRKLAENRWQVFGIATDISDLKRIEAALRDSQALYRSLVEQMPAGIFRKNAEGRYVFVNSTFCRLKHIRPGDYLGRLPDELGPDAVAGKEANPPDKARMIAAGLQHHDSIMRTGRQLELEEMYHGPKGETRCFHVVKSPVFDPDGRIVGSQGILMDITQHKLVEEALRESEARFRSYVENAPLAVLVANRDGRFVDCNRAAVRLLGYEADALRRMRVTEIHPDEDRKLVLQSHDQLINEKHVEGEFRLKKRDGSLVWVSLRAVMVDDDLSIAFCHDINECRMAEVALRESENRYRTLVSASPDAITVTDMEGRIEFVSNRALEIFGHSSESEVVGRHILEWVAPEGHEKARENITYLLTNFCLRENDFVLLKKDGKKFNGEISAVPFRSADGQPKGIIFITRDVTERKRAAEAYMRLATAVDQAAEDIVITDAAGKILYVNPAFEATTGYSQSEAIGRNPRFLKSGKHDDAYYQRMWATLSHGEVWAGHLINKRKDGTLFEEEATISPIRNPAGKIVSYVGVRRDVTREVALAAQLRQAQKMEAIGQLAGGVAHDFNNLLTAIHANASLLLDAQLEAAEAVECSQEIVEAAERAATLTRQLLMFSRKQVMQPVNLDLNEVVTQMTKMLHRILGEDVALSAHYATHLPLIRADAGMIEQVILNLAVNARDAMPAGGRLAITTGTDTNPAAETDAANAVASGTQVWLEVADQGCGISPEHLGHIFEPFFTTKEVGKGTGLGLATVYAIVQQHQGRIEVASEVNRGTTFRIRFPAVSGVKAAKPAVPAISQLPRGSETILLVEDAENVRLITRNLLQRLGYRVLEAESGKAALKVWQENREQIRLLLTDIVMPDGVNGYDLAQRLQSQGPELAVIFTSGYSGDFAGKRTTLVDGVNFLQKPFAPEKLATTVRKNLDRK